jgi:hypothetical protein
MKAIEKGGMMRTKAKYIHLSESIRTLERKRKPFSDGDIY